MYVYGVACDRTVSFCTVGGDDAVHPVYRASPVAETRRPVYRYTAQEKRRGTNNTRSKFTAETIIDAVFLCTPSYFSQFSSHYYTQITNKKSTQNFKTSIRSTVSDQAMVTAGIAKRFGDLSALFRTTRRNRSKRDPGIMA